MTDVMSDVMSDFISDVMSDVMSDLMSSKMGLVKAKQFCTHAKLFEKKSVHSTFLVTEHFW